MARGILEEFVRSCDGFRDVRGQRFDLDVSANLDPECRRVAYRTKHEQVGLCRSCRMNAKPGRKYCLRHLALANERAVRSKRAALGNSVERKDET